MLIKETVSIMPFIKDEMTLPVLYETEQVIVVSKPAGMRVTPFVRFAGGSVLNQVAGYLGTEPFCVHRIDNFTSGCLVLAKTKDAAHELTQNWNERKKNYLAIVEGLCDDDQWKLDHLRVDNPLSVLEGPPSARVESGVSSSHDQRSPKRLRTIKTQTAVTSFQVLSRIPSDESIQKGFTVLKVTLEGTGRKHQIRRHAAEVLKLPLLGDTEYGGNIKIFKRQALHAWEVALKDHIIRCPLPEDFINFFEKWNVQLLEK